MLGRYVTRPGRLEAFGLVAGGDARLDGHTASRPCVESIRTARRVGPSGQIVFDLVAEIIQERHVRASVQAPAFTCTGGATSSKPPAAKSTGTWSTTAGSHATVFLPWRTAANG